MEGNVGKMANRLFIQTYMENTNQRGENINYIIHIHMAMKNKRSIASGQLYSGEKNISKEKYEN